MEEIVPGFKELSKKQRKFHMLFWKKWKKMANISRINSYAFDRIIVNNPRVVWGFSLACNLLDVVGATGSIPKEDFPTGSATLP